MNTEKIKTKLEKNAILKFIKKHDVLIMCLITVIIIIQKSIITPLQPNDVVWNFGNIFKIAQGETIYKDVNIIDTPIFFVLGSWMFKILGSNMNTYEIYNIILSSLTFFMPYIIMKKLKMSKTLSILFTLLINISCNIVIPIGPNYNALALLFVEIGLLLNICAKGNKRENIYKGIIAVLVLLTNQKAGAGYAIATVVIELITCKNMKRAIKNICIIATTGMIGVLIYALYELSRGNLYNMYNLVILSIGNFNNSNFSFSKKSTAILLVFFIEIIINIIMKKKKIINNEETNSIKKIIWIAIGETIIVYPIINLYHILLPTILWIIIFGYDLHIILNKKCKIIAENKYLRILTKAIILMLIVLELMISINVLIDANNKKNELNTNKNSPFYGMIIEEEEQNEIKETEKYINELKEKGYNIRILSEKAFYYTLTMNIKNGYFDLPLKGNLGKEDEQVLINEIKQMKNTAILINEEGLEKKVESYQYVKNVREFVKNTYEKIGKIGTLEVYNVNN